MLSRFTSVPAPCAANLLAQNDFDLDKTSPAAAVMPDGTLILFGGQGTTTTVTSIETLRF